MSADWWRNLAGRRLLIWGVGRHGGGMAAARFCAARGATVELLDARQPQELGLAPPPWPWHQGDAGHPMLRAVDGIVLSPAIPPRAIPADLLSRCLPPEALALAAHRGPRLAITGTKGKSSSVALLAGLLAALPVGNSHEPLCAALDRAGKTAAWVCELSSFQLHHLRQGVTEAGFPVPHFDHGADTGIGSDHLDWHPDLDHYRASKDWLRTCCAAYLPGDAALPVHFRRQAFWYAGRPIARRTDLQLLGRHNIRHACRALSLALAAGVPPEVLPRRLRGVAPLPHRLQPAAAWRGYRFIDDSAATTPAAACAALAALRGPIAHIAGGSDKGADFADLVARWRRRRPHLVLIGATAAPLAAACAAAGLTCHRADDMHAAVAIASRLLGPSGGGITLLSPACASFGSFRDFADRGDQFQQAARDWCARQEKTCV